jgi:hypothetical protein
VDSGRAAAALEHFVAMTHALAPRMAA